MSQNLLCNISANVASAELTSAAELFKEMGMTSEADTILKHLLSESENKHSPNNQIIIKNINELAGLYTLNGLYEKSEALLNRSLSLCEQGGSSISIQAETLLGMARVYAETNRAEDANALVLRARNLFDMVSAVHMDIFDTISDILIKIENYSEAESYLQQSVDVFKRELSFQHPCVGLASMRLADVKHKTCRDVEAETLYQAAISSLRESFGAGHPELADNLMKFAEFYRETERLPAAAMLGKLAVNIMQKTRHSLSALDKGVRKSFDEKCRHIYTKLADILIESERYSEAEQVLGLLKEEQVFAFVRRDAGLSSSLSAISFTQKEMELLNLFSVIPPNNQRCTFSDNNPSPSETQQQSIATSDFDLQRFFDSLVEEMGAAPASRVDRESDLQSDLWELPSGTVAIYAFAAENNFRLILNTPEGRRASSYPIKDSEFNRLIFDFRQALQQPIDNIGVVKELGKKLYDIILAPVETELLANKTHTILWMVEGFLQCMPFAALYDGNCFMVEHFANVLLTPRSKSRMHDSVQPNWNALGMATTRGDELHLPLEHALGEISAIIRDDNSTRGVLPGTKLFDDAFTWDNFKYTLNNGATRYQAIHIATHFHLNPLNDSQCYLLLGDGQKLSLESFRKDPDIRFQGVDIVALSACSTALNLALNNGREIDGIAGIAESKGAKSVLATLWPVEDESTSFVMQTFYRLRETGLTKGEALRMAQNALLCGDHNLQSGHNYAHPFFWAPFILIGNWK